MNRFLFLGLLGLLALVGALVYALGGAHAVFFHPAGPIAARETALMWLSLRLMLLVVVPVYVLAAAIVWRYRAGNASARYLPNWEHNTIEEAVWWMVPLLIILVLAGVTWTSSHELDPFRAISATTTPLSVEVVALDWKWLFIYPAQGVASVNYLPVPIGVPVDFSLTADAPMNALWIPALAGQEMAMPGMITHLNVEADATGTYAGLSANYSGAGFAGMRFSADAMSPEDFAAWVAKTKKTAPALDGAAYAALAEPSENVPPSSSVLSDPSLYTDIVMKYMEPATSTLPSMGSMHAP